METSFTFKRSTASRPRPDIQKGWVKIEHVATGKFILHLGKHLASYVNEQLDLLVSGDHPQKKFQKLFDTDDELKITYHANNNIAEITRELKQLRKELSEKKLSYLLIE